MSLKKRPKNRLKTKKDSLFLKNPGFRVFLYPAKKEVEQHEVIIVGGGLAGLTAGIHLARRGVKTALFEKEDFPHHKVCGEYLSKEILPYFEQLEIPFNELNPKNISRLKFSSSRGKSLEVPLPLGAIGVSRFALDNLLYERALLEGVEVIHEKVTDIQFKGEKFEVISSEKIYTGNHLFGAYGKRSLLDRNLEREFFKKPAPWMALKRHYKNDSFPEDLVELNNFKGGYCGLSKTESGAVNMCYLATYESFKAAGNPEIFESNVLRKNPFLKSFLDASEPLFEKPLTIAQVSFSRKEAVYNHMLMLGDSAGLIHPLCGNGMAMAIHSAKMASESYLAFRESLKKDRLSLENDYRQKWNNEFRNRMKTGKILQQILLNEKFAQASQQLISMFPFLLPQIIKRTHGRPLTMKA